MPMQLQQNMLFCETFCLTCIAIISLSFAAPPQQVSLTYGAVPEEIVVMWVVEGGNKTEGRVEYGVSEGELQWTAVAVGDEYRLFPYKSPMIYSATMKGLKTGNQLYYYRVGSGTSGFSEVFTFKSHPGVGASDVTFHLVGDPGQTDNTQTTLNELLESYNAVAGLTGGIVCVGDLSYANRIEKRWDTFGQLLQPTVSQVPMQTTVGNHEWRDDVRSEFIAYKARYYNPPVNGTKELYYSFNAGLVHWVMVAGYCHEMKLTSTQPCLASDSPQLNWLQADLAAVDRSVTPWVFVVFHQPYMNSNNKHNIASEGAPMQKAIEEVLYASRVDAVFSGHVHAYERCCQAYHYECQNGAPYYITIGDGGNAEGLATSWVDPQPTWSVFRQASYGFGRLRVENSTHAHWQWHQNGDLTPTIADEVWFVKQSAMSGNNEWKKEPRRTGQPMFASSVRGGAAAKNNIERMRTVSLTEFS